MCIRDRLNTVVFLLLTLATTPAALAASNAPAFELPGDSGQISLEQYRDQVVFVDFWASWCVPCRRSFPWLNAMHAKYAEQGLVIVGVNLDMERSDAAKFLEEYPAEFAVVYDADKQLARQFEVIAMPSSYVFGRDGQIAARHMGFKVKQQDEYEALIVKALRASGASTD